MNIKDKNELISDVIADKLRKECNAVISDFLNHDKFERIPFRNAVSALCVKLSLYVGTTYRIVREIRIDDYDKASGILMVCGYPISLPLLLNSQIKKYREILSKTCFVNEPKYLFVNPDGSQWGEKTAHSGIPNFLSRILKDDSNNECMSFNAIVKYGLSNLVLSGLRNEIISKLTGAGKELIENSVDKSKMFAHINSCICQTEFYIDDCDDLLETDLH